MEIIWHPLASNDFDQIIFYYRDTFGIKTARKVRDTLHHDIYHLLISHPSLGFCETSLDNIDQLTYRSLVSGHIKIIYTIHDKYLYIHMLWDCRRNPELLQSEMKERK
ncbi:type II toxin-antitoxin system RelE/ParE family toxin [Parabacteroides faecis]|uniref:type II toxin-antitoxin system RelE/ParE family toxin n=1 Tax=Parabacteroides faecis TaxID=1217282 RepID=UPI0035226540